MEEPRLEFVLRGAGWATLEIAAGSTSQRIESISYCTDALDDLLRMGLDIATDKGWATASFDHEPSISVLAAETAWWEDGRWEAGARLSSFQLPQGVNADVPWDVLNGSERDFVIQLEGRDELARLFLDCARRVLDEHGAEGYRKLWGGRLAFPLRAMSALEAALETVGLPPVHFRP